MVAGSGGNRDPNESGILRERQRNSGQATRERADRHSGGIKPSGGRDDVILPGSEPCDSREVQDDRVGRLDRRCRRDAVEISRRSEIKSQRGDTGSLAEAENAGSQRNDLPDPVEQAQISTSRYRDTGGSNGRSGRAGETQRTGIDGKAADEAKTSAAQGEGAGPFFDQGKIVLIRSYAAKVAGIGGGGGLIYSENRKGGITADDRVVYAGP